jgi:hypothetical protein
MRCSIAHLKYHAREKETFGKRLTEKVMTIISSNETATERGESGRDFSMKVKTVYEIN